MLHGVRAGWGVYAATCAALPLLWGLAVYWVLRRLPEGRSDGSAPDRPNQTGMRDEDYRI